MTLKDLQSLLTNNTLELWDILWLPLIILLIWGAAKMDDVKKKIRRK